MPGEHSLCQGMAERLGTEKALLKMQGLEKTREERLVNTTHKGALERIAKLLEDPDFGGRGYAAWALAKVLGPLDPRPAEAVALLRETADSSEGYVKALSESGLRTLTR